jgi:hypothetical protein
MMYHPLVAEQVRVSNRTGEFVVCVVDLAARAADIHLVDNPAAIERVPFQLLFPAGQYDRAGADRYFGQDRLEANRNVLRSTQAHLARTYIVLADLQDILNRTMDIIHASRQLIQASDQLIARTRTLDGA